jgi:hypothetical protein
MTYVLRFLSEVEDDAINGYIWYETKSYGLGDEFLRMFYACVGDILRNPLLYQKVHSEFRRCLLRRFPYAIYFIINNDQIMVTGLFHCARDPRDIESKLRDRKESKQN